MGLSIENLTVVLDRRPVLRQIALTVGRGEVIGVIGPNGAGKSTLLRAVAGTLAPTSGAIRLDGSDLARLSVAARARQIAVVPQSVALPRGLRVADLVLMGRTPHLPLFGGERARDYRVAQAAMQRTNTAPLAERWVSDLSGGEQQRVLVARALAQEPAVLLLDEVTAHLDLKYQGAILGLVRRMAGDGLIVLAALHDLNLAALYADRLALLREGRLLVCGPPAAVLTPRWLRLAYEVHARVVPHPAHGTPVVSLVLDDGAKEAICDRVW